MSLLLAMTEGERIALIGIAASIAAGVPGIIAAIISQRTRNENTEQHGESQKKLEEVHTAVITHGVKLDDMQSDVRVLTEKVDEHSEQIARHSVHIDNHLHKLNKAGEDPHPVL